MREPIAWTRRTIAGVALAAMMAVVAACGGDDDVADAAGSTDESAADEQSDSADPPSSDEASGASPDEAGQAVATLAVNGMSFEFTEILECEIGDDWSGDYREFHATTADGSASIDITYQPDESLAWESATMEVFDRDGTVGSTTWSTDYVGADAGFDIVLRPDGAQGTAQVASVGSQGSEDQTAMVWAFTC